VLDLSPLLLACEEDNTAAAAAAARLPLLPLRSGAMAPGAQQQVNAEVSPQQLNLKIGGKVEMNHCIHIHLTTVCVTPRAIPLQVDILIALLGSWRRAAHVVMAQHR
jgi:hypothetical protein